MPDDLSQAYALLVAGRKVGKNMFAFYNCECYLLRTFESSCYFV